MRMKRIALPLGAVLIAGSATVGALTYKSSGDLRDVTPAAGWFEKQRYDLAAFKDMLPKDAVLRLNQAVYSFCRSGSAPADLDDMYIDCVGQCGGFSYVLRGLLDEIGIQNRYANLYNIPMQGNHSAVEALVGDRWIFVDPTFGVAFSDDGTAEGHMLSLDEVYHTYRHEKLEDLVLQARKKSSDAAKEALALLYDGVFSHDYMELRNYKVAERVDYGLDGRILNLDIPLWIENGRAEIGGKAADGSENLEGVWLDLTNQTLLDDQLLNDVSFNTSYLYPDKLVTLSLFDLEPDLPYKLGLLIKVDRGGQTLQVANVGKGMQIDRSEHPLAREGVHEVEVGFTSKRSTGAILLRSVGTSKLRLFGVQVIENPTRQRSSLAQRRIHKIQ